MLFPEQSLIIQSSTIPSLTEFFTQTKFIVSNVCQNISILIAYYLQQFGIDSKVICGINHCADQSIAIPHVFLKFGEHVIDNTYVHYDSEITAQQNLDKFIIDIAPFVHNVENYVEERPSETRLTLTGWDTQKSEWMYLEEGCKTQLNQWKLVAAVMNSSVINPGTLIYDRLMRIFIKNEFGIEIQSLQDLMKETCWHCGLTSKDLKMCSGCKFGKYCNKNCLTYNLKTMHRTMHKIIRMGNNSEATKCISN